MKFFNCILAVVQGTLTSILILSKNNYLKFPIADAFAAITPFVLISAIFTSATLNALFIAVLSIITFKAFLFLVY